MNKQQHFDLIRNYKGGDGMEIDIKIDSLTNCLISEETHEEFDTEYKLFRKTISASQAKELQDSGWLFDWSIPQMKGEEIFGLYIVGSDELQGLIALKHERQNYFTFVDVVESAPHNRGKNKKFSGVGAHLFAIACKLSFEVGNDGYVSFLAKTNLVNHYTETLGATSISGDGRKMVITTKSSIKLVEKYFKEEN